MIVLIGGSDDDSAHDDGNSGVMDSDHDYGRATRRRQSTFCDHRHVDSIPLENNDRPRRRDGKNSVDDAISYTTYTMALVVTFISLISYVMI